MRHYGQLREHRADPEEPELCEGSGIIVQLQLIQREAREAEP